MNTLIVGTGSFGQAIAKCVSENGHSVSLLGRKSSSQTKELPWRVYDETDFPFEQRFESIIFALSTIYLKEALKFLEKVSCRYVFSCSKGLFDDPKDYTPYQTLQKSFTCPIAVLSGPTFAKVLSQSKPTVIICAHQDQNQYVYLKNLMERPYFKVLESKDIVGVEWSGILKNCVALATGYIEGLELGENARAAVITRGFQDILSITTFFGGSIDSVISYTGLGDLVLTGTSSLSRNWQFGYEFSQGSSREEISKKLSGVPEGWNTLQVISQIIAKHNIKAPFFESMQSLFLHKEGSWKELVFP